LFETFKKRNEIPLSARIAI